MMQINTTKNGNLFLPKFSATHSFNVTPATDIMPEAQQRIEEIKAFPLMRTVKESVLYPEGEQADEFLWSSLEEEPAYKVSAFLDADNNLIVNTPGEGDEDFAREAALVRYIMTELGVTLEAMKEFLPRVLNGMSVQPNAGASTEKSSIATVRKREPQPEPVIDDFEVLEEFDIIEPDTSIPDKFIKGSWDHEMFIYLIEEMKKNPNEDYLLSIANVSPPVQKYNHSMLYPLMELATEKGHLKIIHYLRKKGMPIHKEDYGRIIAKVQDTAAENGQVKVLQYLLKQGYTLEQHDLDGPNLLKLAVKHAQIEVVDFLISQGIETLAFDSYESDQPNIIEYAVQSNQFEMLKHLLENLNIPMFEEGYEPTTKMGYDPEGKKLLCAAAKTDNLEMFSYLYELLVKPHPDRDVARNYTLGYFGNHNNPAITAAESGSIDILNFLGKKSTNLLFNTSNSNNIFLAAAKNNHPEVVQTYFTKFPLYFTAKGKEGNIPLHYLVPFAFTGGKQEEVLSVLKMIHNYNSGNFFEVENNDGKTVWDMVPDRKMLHTRKATLKKMMKNAN